MLESLLHLADNALILGHRNSEWTGHGPILEQDIAISNIALDLVGQARHCYQYAANLMNEAQPTSRQTEDTLAFLRGPEEFSNFKLLELPKGDWSFTILRQFIFSAWQKTVWEKCMTNNDERLAGIAEKSIKETRYHLRWSGEWVIRLGDGTSESRKRIINSMEMAWPYTTEFFVSPGNTTHLKENFVSRQDWLQIIRPAFQEADLAEELSDMESRLDFEPIFQETSPSAHLVSLLSEMQFLQRTYPGAEW